MSRKAKTPEIKSLVGAGRFLGIDRKTLEDWRTEGCPGIPPQPFNEAAIKKWAAANGKRAAAPTNDLRARKTLEEIRKLKIRNDREEAKVVDRAWVADRFARVASRLNSFRAESEASHPLEFDAAPDVATKRAVLRRIWTSIFTEIQAAGEEFR